MSATKTAAELAAKIDWRAHGATSFEVDRIVRIFKLLDEHGPLDTSQIAAKLPANARTGKSVHQRTVLVWLRVPVAEGALIARRRYLGRHRDGRKAGRDLDLFEPCLEGLSGLTQARRKKTTRSHLAERLKSVDWPKYRVSFERGSQIASLCESIDSDPKLSCVDRAIRLGVGKSTLKTNLRFGESLGLIETVDGNDRWPKEAALRRVNRKKIESLERMQSSAPSIDPMRTLPVGERPSKRTRLDSDKHQAVLAADFQGVVKTVDQANATRKILLTIGDSFDQGSRVLRSELNIAQSTLEKHLALLRKYNLIVEGTHRRNGTFGPRKTFAVNWDTLEQLPTIYKRPKASANCDAKPGATNTGPAKPHWDAARLELRLGHHSRAFAPQAKVIIKLLGLFQEAGWPEKIDSPFRGDIQGHKDAVKALKRCRILSFSSATQGTAIAWKVAQA